MKEELRDLKSFGNLGTREALYPPILDRDPEFAAAFLTIEDSTFYLPIIREALKAVIAGDYESTPLIFTIGHSDFNYKWFRSFLKHLEILVYGKQETKIPMLDCLPNSKRLIVYPPYHKSTSKMIYDKFRVKTRDPIDLYRITYIRKDVELDDFRDGFPAWYLMSTSTVFEQYNEVTNTRVRIDFRNGEFYYYISGASDNWKQIQDIPLEMDHVVSALLFRS